MRGDPNSVFGLQSLTGSGNLCFRSPIEQQRARAQGGESAGELSEDEARRVGWANAGEGVGERTRQCHGRVGKGGGGLSLIHI